MRINNILSFRRSNDILICNLNNKIWQLYLVKRNNLTIISDSKPFDTQINIGDIIFYWENQTYETWEEKLWSKLNIFFLKLIPPTPVNIANCLFFMSSFHLLHYPQIGIVNIVDKPILSKKTENVMFVDASSITPPMSILFPSPDVWIDVFDQCFENLNIIQRNNPKFVCGTCVCLALGAGRYSLLENYKIPDVDMSEGWESLQKKCELGLIFPYSNLGIRPEVAVKCLKNNHMDPYFYKTHAWGIYEGRFPIMKFEECFSKCETALEAFLLILDKKLETVKNEYLKYELLKRRKYF